MLANMDRFMVALQMANLSRSKVRELNLKYFNSATQWKIFIRNRQHVFAIDMCKVSNEFEPNCKEPIVVEDFFYLILL